MQTAGISKSIYFLMQFMDVRISKISVLDVISYTVAHIRRPLAICYLSLYHPYCSVERLIAIVVRALD